MSGRGLSKYVAMSNSVSGVNSAQFKGLVIGFRHGFPSFGFGGRGDLVSV